MFLLVSSTVSAETVEDDDFWLLLDYEPVQNIVWLFAGKDEFDGTYYGAAADLVISDPVHFIFSATQQDYTVDTTAVSWGFNVGLDESFSLGIFKDFWGKRNSLEKDDLRMQLSYYRAAFNVQFSYETGDVELFLQSNRPRVKNSSITIDHNASKISFGYRWPQFYWQLSHKENRYQKDLSLLQTQPRLQLVVTPLGVQQASALSESDSTILLGYQQTQTFYEMRFSRIRSVVTNEANNYFSARVSTALNAELQLGLDIELPLNDVPLSAGLSLGILW